MDELENDLAAEVEGIRSNAREQEEALKRQLEDSRGHSHSYVHSTSIRIDFLFDFSFDFSFDFF